MTTVSDDFNRADSATSLGVTSVGGLTWTAVSGTWGISSNQAYLPVHSGGRSVATVDAGAADGTLLVTLASISGGFGLALRAQDANNLLALFYQSGSIILLEVVGGSTTTKSTTTQTVSAGDTLSAVLSGSSITVKYNGSTLATVTDTNFQTLTEHGLYEGSGVGTQRWDDWSFTTVTAARKRPSIIVRSRAIARASVI